MEEAKKHANRTSEPWIRATLGPIIWLGIPIAISYMLMKRMSGPTVKGASGGTGYVAGGG